MVLSYLISVFRTPVDLVSVSIKPEIGKNWMSLSWITLTLMVFKLSIILYLYFFILCSFLYFNKMNMIIWFYEHFKLWKPYSIVVFSLASLYIRRASKTVDDTISDKVSLSNYSFVSDGEYSVTLPAATATLAKSDLPFFPSSPMELFLVALLCIISVLVLTYTFVVSHLVYFSIRILLLINSFTNSQTQDEIICPCWQERMAE